MSLTIIRICKLHNFAIFALLDGEKYILHFRPIEEEIEIVPLLVCLFIIPFVRVVPRSII